MHVVGGALIDNKRLLVGLRAKGKQHADMWEIPGGKVEPGEDGPSALRREFEEELGCTIEVHEAIGEVTLNEPSATLVFVAYRCSLSAGRPVALEHQELRWIGEEELERLMWAPADRPLLDRFAHALRGSR